MKKPKPGASEAEWRRYREWVRAELETWDPADDRGNAEVYVPRYNGIQAVEVENVSERVRDDDDSD